MRKKEAQAAPPEQAWEADILPLNYARKCYGNLTSCRAAVKPESRGGARTCAPCSRGCPLRYPSTLYRVAANPSPTPVSEKSDVPIGPSVVDST